jgi:hypothetical protein
MKLEWRLLVAGQVLGLALLLVAWVKASGELQPKGQIGWLNLGVAGATIAVAAGVRVVTRARHAVTARQQVVVGALRHSNLRSVGVIDLRSHPVADDAPVSSAAMTRYHRAGCLLAAGKPVAPATRPSHEAAGRRPCGVCTP